MSKDTIKDELSDLVSGTAKKNGILVVFKSQEGTYRYGSHAEKIMTADELAQIRSQYDKVVIFSKKSKQ